MAHVKVELKVDKAGRVFTDPAPVIVNPGDTIEWRCDAGDVTVSFKGQKLLDGAQELDGKKGKATDTARIKGDVARGKHFDCMITLNGLPMGKVYGVDTSGSGE